MQQNKSACVIPLIMTDDGHTQYDQVDSKSFSTVLDCNPCAHKNSNILKPFVKMYVKKNDISSKLANLN